MKDGLKFHSPSAICGGWLGTALLSSSSAASEDGEEPLVAQSLCCVDPARALSFLSLHLHKAAPAAPECSLLFCFFDNVDYRLSTFVLSYWFFACTAFWIRKKKKKRGGIVSFSWAYPGWSYVGFLRDKKACFFWISSPSSNSRSVRTSL